MTTSWITPFSVFWRFSCSFVFYKTKKKLSLQIPVVIGLRSFSEYYYCTLIDILCMGKVFFLGIEIPCAHTWHFILRHHRLRLRDSWCQSEIKINRPNTWQEHTCILRASNIAFWWSCESSVFLTTGAWHDDAILYVIKISHKIFSIQFSCHTSWSIHDH